MLRPHPLDMDELHQALKRARRRGVRASRLVRHAPHIIDLLYPAARYPALSVHDRATATENLITAAVDCLGDEVRHMLSILLCLTPDTLYVNLQRRREMVAEHVGVLPGTWERGWREPQLFDDLAAEIYRLHHTDPGAYLPDTMQPV
jgi:hypothetical protein